MKHILISLLFATPALADPVTILDVTRSGDRFDVTVEHPDTGWDHYADGWRIELEDGTVLGTRVLFHPHVNEQPFTRSDTIKVPDGVTTVYVRARCNVDGWNEDRVAFQIEDNG